MPKIATLQTNFAAGEIDAALALRRDTKQYAAGAESLRNNRLLIGGGARRRPGSKLQIVLPAQGRIIEFIVQSTAYVVVFASEAMRAYERDSSTGDLTLAATLSGCPWTGTTWRTMDIAASGGTLIITHPDFMHVVAVDEAGAFAQAIFPFSVAANGRIRQPHFKIAPWVTTVQPSALTGSITLTANPGWWSSAHVGARIRILDREILITGVSNTVIAQGTVVDPLRATQRLTVTSSAGFAVDEVVTGETSGAKGIITSIPDPTHIDVTLISTEFGVSVTGGTTTKELLAKTGGKQIGGGGFTVKGITVPEAFTTGAITTQADFAAENLIGPNATTAVSAVASGTPAAVKQWTEQLYSDRWGYPNCVEVHRGRVLFAGGGAAPSAIAGSSLTDVFDFDVRDASDAEGFVETIGDAAAVEIRQMHSTEQLLILTDKGPYYVPESPQNPFRPSGLAFNHFGGEWPCSSVRTGDFDGGVIMVSGSTVVKMSPTGNQTALWEAEEVSFLSPGLFRAPVDAAFCFNYNDGPERYAVFVNFGGSLAVMQLIDREAVRNVTPWNTRDTDSYISACSIGGDIYVVVDREISGSGTQHWLERFDDDLTLDGVTEYETEDDLDDIPLTYLTETVNIVVQPTLHLGTDLTALPEIPAGPYEVGFTYTRTIRLLAPHIEDGRGDHSGEMMRLVSATIHTLESARFSVQGFEIQAWLVDENLAEAPPLRTGPQRITLAGWSREPKLQIEQPDPLPLTVLGVRVEVAY